jgi:hypothetical protein
MKGGLSLPFTLSNPVQTGGFNPIRKAVESQSPEIVQRKEAYGG